MAETYQHEHLIEQVQFVGNTPVGSATGEMMCEYPRGYVTFKGPNSEKKTGLSKEQLAVLLESFSELEPYLKDYYFMYTRCPLTGLTHIGIVFNFIKDVGLQVVSLSPETVARWRLEGTQSQFDLRTNDPQVIQGRFYVGTPPIARVLPPYITKQIVAHPENYHYGGSECFN